MSSGGGIGFWRTITSNPSYSGFKFGHAADDNNRDMGKKRAHLADNIDTRCSGEKVVADDEAKLVGCRTEQSYGALRAGGDGDLEAGGAQNSFAHP